MRLKRNSIAVLLGIFSFTAIAAGQPAKPKTTQAAPKKPPCAKNLAECPDEGCGGKFDPNLNKGKNIISSDKPVTPHTLTWMKKLEDPESFTDGESRDELTELGEGNQVSVVAYALVVRAELGGESCNCGLKTKEETDNHIVLVTKATVDKFPIAGDPKATLKLREAESETAEFTPRVRRNGHPNFTREKLQPLVNKAAQQALLVRVTGPLLFDSEHFIRNHLLRVNNWEIHPIMKLEFCETGNKCRAKSDTGWKSLDDLP